MYKIEFSLSSPAGEVHEFDLGDIEITTESKVVSSKRRSPDQSMMVFIAASDLLSGLLNLYLNRKKKEFEFIGADSSFQLVFKKNKVGKLEIYHEREKLGEINAIELVRVAFKAANDLYIEYGEKLLGSGAAKEDLEYVMDSALKLLPA